MAQKRMFDKGIIDSDLFIDLPIPSQCLYFHLSMRADDEGFIGNVKGIIRLVGFKEEDLRPLIDREFILIFETGVIVIKHWKLNNYLRKDRIKETEYKEERLKLQTKDNKYIIGLPNDTQMLVNGVPSIEENSIEENSIEYIHTESKPKKNKYGEYKNVLLSKTEYSKLETEYDNLIDLIKFLDEYIEMKGYKAKSHYLCIKKWVIDAVNNNKNKKFVANPIWFDKKIQKEKASNEEIIEMKKLFEEEKES